jgi:dienelactone hydrolase
VKTILLALLILILVVGAGAQTNSMSLKPLLLDTRGKAILSERQWSKQRKHLESAWREVLGALPKSKAALKAVVLATEELPTFTRQHIKYQIEAGEFTDGYLLTPKNLRGRLPAVVVFHPTTPVHAKGVAGVAADYEVEKRQGVQLVARGYIVWCPRNYIYNEGADWKGNAQRVAQRHPGRTGMGQMVWEAIRAADYLESLPNVDKKRIGCLGHSLGGKEVLFAMAFDERYRAGVSSEGGIGLRMSNWDAPWYLGEQINAPQFRRENHEVLAMVAPRAVVLLAGNSADDARSATLINAAKPIYELRGAKENLQLLNHGLGHRYPPGGRAAAEDFLDRHLKPRKR